MITKEKAEYLCEIAFLVGGETKWMVETYNKNKMFDLNYTDWFSFYEYIFDRCNERKEKISILELIYRKIKDDLHSMFIEFLSTYKK